jgi:uncharacterized protein Yka (UPF0111/DUF47 family)
MRIQAERGFQMFNLLPKDTVFYDLFEGLAEHVVSCAGHLHALASDFPNATEQIARIRQEEHDADQLTHQALDRLDRTFITPFDREDIHALVGELDSIVDNINALANASIPTTSKPSSPPSSSKPKS